MADKIFLNKQPLNFTENDLPCLITYADKTGGSHFSITLVVGLFLRGSKILFLTAYPMAKDNFLQQVGEDRSKIAFVTSVEELEKAKDVQVIILESGNEALFNEAVKILPDLKERVILVKNMEVFGKIIFDTCLNMEKVILSGDIDKCADKERISKKDFITIIAFSKPEIPLIDVPALEKYTGFLIGDHKMGMVVVQKNQ